MVEDTRSHDDSHPRSLAAAHRAWTARAFCMATAQLRGSFEPDEPATREHRVPVRPRVSRRALLAVDINDV